MKINIENFADGAFSEKLNDALIKVAENIQDPNTDPTAKRAINISIKFAPGKNRQIANTSITVATKLTPAEAIDTQMVMGTDIRPGRVEISEYNGQVKGQMSIADLEEPAEEAKPIDLRNRQSAAELEFDPDTGEIYGREKVMSIGR